MIPLIIAGGAGANGNRVLALGVTAGMAVGTLALVFVVPAFFIVFQNLHEKVHGVPVAVASGEVTAPAQMTEIKAEEKVVLEEIVKNEEKEVKDNENKS